MRTYRHWAQIEGILADPAHPVRVTAGSNHSEAEARREAERRLAWLRDKVQGKRVPDEAYEADIREAILEEPSPEAVITRNRYGAHVLNCARLPILDIDEPPRSFWDFFAASSPERRLARMEKALVQQAKDPSLGFRLYATAKGFRVILLGRACPPREAVMQGLAKALGVDSLYWMLCLKQGCYRARLTPKPYRMKAPTLKVPFPATPDQQLDVARWEEGYLVRARAFATCRFLRSFGSDRPDALVKLHDARTGAFEDRPLA